MPPISKDTIVAILSFVVAVLTLLMSQPFVSAALLPWIQFAIGVIGIALAIFFGVVKPIAKAFAEGRQNAIGEMKNPYSK